MMFVDFIRGRGALGLLILRIAVGIAFMLHGWPKIQHPFDWMGSNTVPSLLQALAALSEFGGGFALILGLLTPIAAFGIFCTMTTALAMVHIPHGDPFIAPKGWHGSTFEIPLIYLCISVLFMLIGPGEFSLDALLFRRRSNRRFASPVFETKTDAVTQR